MNIKCEYCGEEVRNVTSRRRFCSQKCADANRYIKKEKTGFYTKCAYCGEEVYKKNCYKGRFENYFCNREHQIAYQKSKSFKMKCEVCGKWFYCQPSQVSLRNRACCSVECSKINQSKKIDRRRLSSGMTKRQINRCIRYSKKMDDWRISVFQRDDYTCQECGERGGYLEAHHIKPFAYFPELRFELSNGMTLCRKCHNKTKISASEMKEKYDNLIK